MIGVCYAYSRNTTPLQLPAGVLSLTHVNLGEEDRPLAAPGITAQTDRPLGRVLNFEPERIVPTPLEEWPLIFRKYWPKQGRVIAYGIDASVNNPRWDHPIGKIAKALRRSSPPGKPPEYASFGLDGYVRPGYTLPRQYHPWVKWRADRLAAVASITGTRSSFFVDVQDQWAAAPYGDGLRLHPAQVVEMQIAAAGSNDIIIFAGASTPAAQSRVDEAVLSAVRLAEQRKGIT